MTVSGGLASAGSIVDGGAALVIGNGLVSAFMVSSGGTLSVGPDGNDAGNTIGIGGTLFVSGSHALAIGDTVQSGGVVDVLPGGVISSFKISAGGSGVILSGGTDSASTIGGGGFEQVAGTAKFDLLSGAGALQVVESGGTSISARSSSARRRRSLSAAPIVAG